MALTVLKLGLVVASLLLAFAAVSALAGGQLLAGIALLAMTFLVVLVVAQMG